MIVWGIVLIILKGAMLLCYILFVFVWMTVYGWIMLGIVAPLMLVEAVLYGWAIKNPPIKMLWRWLGPYFIPPFSL